MLLAVALGGVVAGAVLLGDSWFQLLVALGLGIVLTQIAFLGHDAGHQQIFRKRRSNDIAGTIAGNLFVGLSYGWWVDEHTRHHTNPNHEDLDPDIAESVLAFTSSQVDARQRRSRASSPSTRPACSSRCSRSRASTCTSRRSPTCGAASRSGTRAWRRCC